MDSDSPAFLDRLAKVPRNKAIPGYEGLYEVTHDGQVVSFSISGSGKPLKQLRNKKGYMVVCLNKKGKKKTFRVHRLVAFAFVDLVYGKPVVNHKDGKRDNNHYTNLEWTTVAENNLHSYRVLGRVHALLGKRGKDCDKSKPLRRIMPSGRIDTYINGRHASREVGASTSSVSDWVCGISKPKDGSRWEFV